VPTWRIALSVVVIAVIIIGSYYVTALIGKQTARTRSGRSIMLRDRFAVSKDKAFYLVEVKDKVYLVAISNQAIALLDTLDAAQFREEARAPFWSAGASNAGWRGKPRKILAEFLRRLLGRPEPPDELPFETRRGESFESVFREARRERTDADDTADTDGSRDAAQENSEEEL
jgi:flagellar biogenesis protein FliO